MKLYRRSLGQTDLHISPIGLGVMQFAGGRGMFKAMFPIVPDNIKNKIIRRALEGGINWFDTAEMYGRGNSEQGLAAALKTLGKQDDEVIVGTKWFPIFRTAKSIYRTIDDRLRYLDGYTIDLYMVHQPWGFSSLEAEMNAMADLAEDGKIRSVGVSNFNADQMRRAHDALAKRGLPLAVNQMQYSLLYRNIETNGVLDTAKELGITIVAWSPLASGILSGRYHDNPEIYDQLPFARKVMMRNKIKDSGPIIEALKVFAQKYDATAAQVALNWIVNFHGDTVVAIPGASKVHQAEESTGVMKFKLSDEEMALLDTLSSDYR